MSVGPICSGFKADAPVNIICPEETDIYARVACRFEVLSHFNGVVLVVSRDHDSPMILGSFPTLVKVNIGPIRNVKAEALNEDDEFALAS